MSLLIGNDTKSALGPLYRSDRRIEVKSHLILQFRIKIFQYHIVNIRPQMAHGGIQQIQVVLQAKLLKMRACRRIQLRPLTAVFHIDLIHIAHQLNGLLFPYILVKSPSKVIGNIILSV